MTEAPLAVTGEWQAINLINFPRGWKKEEAKVLLTYELTPQKNPLQKKKKKKQKEKKRNVSNSDRNTKIRC